MKRGDRTKLEGTGRSRTAPRRQVERARVVLGAAAGRSGYELSDELVLSRPTIQRWLDRYEARGLEGLDDRARSGRPRTLTPEIEAEVLRHTLEEKPPRGTHWSSRLLAKLMGLHHSQITRIWKAHRLKPHRVRYFKLSTDPRFVEKLRDVVGLYVAPPERSSSASTRRARSRPLT